MRHLDRAITLMLLAALGLAASATEVCAGNLNVAYINATGASVDYLSSYGINVTYLNNPIGLTLADLAPYDAVLTTGNAAFSDPTNLGNVLAQFADSGRGVVLTTFDYFSLGGSIMTASYSPVTLLSSNYYNHNSSGATLGTIYDPSNPIFAGVNTSQVISQYNLDVGLNPGATLVADYATDLTIPPVFGQTRHAVAYTPLANSSVVFLNLFPGTGITQNLGFDSDDELMIANALKFADTSPHPSSAVPEPSTLLLACLGGVCSLVFRKRRRLLDAA